MDLKGKKIFVGLSGGVDSAVTAALLKKAEASVSGVFIKGWYPPDMPCTWAEDRRDAMRVAARLNIPFYTLEAATEYKKGVIDYLLAEYAAGRTPNPDIMCNREVKFGVFFEFAKNAGAEFIATGHYARARHDSKKGTGLLRGIDKSKDQSYFLWAIPQKVLNHALFPLGELRKEEVRKLANDFNIPVANKKDSQGICFLGSISVDEFLRKELSTEPGIAIDESGNQVGLHEGVLLYTLGERIALTYASSGPWYVLKKDMKSNILIVSNRHMPIEKINKITLQETNWFDTRVSTNILGQYRYHGPLVAGTLSNDLKNFIPLEPLSELVAPGQSLVLYEGEVCLGGGIIA